MSAATSVFIRAMYATAAGLASQAEGTSRKAVMRGMAAAMIVGSAISPVMAQSDGEFSASQGRDAPAISASAVGGSGPGVVDGVKQIGTGIGNVIVGVGRFLASASDATATIGSGTGLSSEPVVGQLGAEQREAYDKLAIGAAAQRLVAEAAFGAFADKREAFALAPRNEAKAREVLLARKNLDREVAALNIAVAEFGNATGVLSKRYVGTDFGAYKALQASISSPIELRAGAVTPDKPIYPQAEALAIQIMAGEVPRATSVSPGRNATPAVTGRAEVSRLAYRSK